MEQGHTVTVLDDLSAGKKENLSEVIHEIHFNIGTVTDLRTVDTLVKSDHIDKIFHLATPCLVMGLENPKMMHDVTDVGTFNICLVAKNNSCRLAYISTSEIYGNLPPESYPISEEVVPNPVSVYGLTKFVGEQYVRFFHFIYDLPSVIIRPFNTYGARHREDNYSCVVTNFIKQAQKGQCPIVYGDGKQTRDFCVTGETLILMSNLSWKPIKDISPGEKVISFDEIKNNKRMFKISVIDKVTKYKSTDVYEIKTESGNIKATGNHPWLMVKRGFRNTCKIKENIKRYKSQRLRKFSTPIFYTESEEYVEGYIHGSIEGDGHVKCYRYGRSTNYVIDLSVTDIEFRDEVYKHLLGIGFKVSTAERQPKYKGSKRCYTVRDGYKEDYLRMIKFLKNKKWSDKEFCRGYIAGIFDAEGEYHGSLRISNKNRVILNNIINILTKFNFKVNERKKLNGASYIIYISILGGLEEMARFFAVFQPKISRKRPNFETKEVKGKTSLVLEINKVEDQDVYNLVVRDNHTYIANGFLCHNTYIDDIVEGIIMLSGFEDCSVFNIGSGVDITMLDLAKMVWRVWGYKNPPSITWTKPRPHDVRKLQANITKAFRYGYEPKTDLMDGLQKYIDWMFPTRVVS